MQRRDFVRFTLAGAAGLMLSGCGFRLRGLDQPAMGLKALAIAGTDDAFARLAAERLASAGVAVRDDAPLVLNLGAERIDERRLGVLDSGSQERELTLRVPFSVQRRADGAYRLDQQVVEVSERFTVSDDNLLASDDLREAASERLRRDAVRRLMDRLRALPPA
ncbi:LPS-assembly lipoprotein LptE [Halomonas organivorans]|uniref:LPS-assembly lipoprotein LptE n=1 Tax=Halomonas organivorans TaxID=257772 RepID=A0A7W5BVT8_9GAMM|nr:LPS assembly lipoprotein LptE [Halomonas organivorans]MBB3140041.1 LPS-assembly lipoprotein [Halomonas organivorans]